MSARNMGWSSELQETNKTKNPPTFVLSHLETFPPLSVFLSLPEIYGLPVAEHIWDHPDGPLKHPQATGCSLICSAPKASWERRGALCSHPLEISVFEPGLFQWSPYRGELKIVQAVISQNEPTPLPSLHSAPYRKRIKVCWLMNVSIVLSLSVCTCVRAHTHTHTHLLGLVRLLPCAFSKTSGVCKSISPYTPKSLDTVRKEF